MSHLEPQLIYEMWYEVSGDYGTEFVPYDIVGDLEEVLQDASGSEVRHVKHGKIIGWDLTAEAFDPPKELTDYLENRILYEVRLRPGYGVRLSAPGFLDATDWQVYNTRKEAEAALRELERK
jgi:hypothetical protein